MSLAYEPSRSISAILSRRLTPFLSRRVVNVNLDRPIVSFTFDDCPLSAVENGVRPLEQNQWNSTIYVSGGLLGETNHHGLQISKADVQALHRSGHEIGGHTWSHIDAQSIDIDVFTQDMERNQSYMSSLGVPSFRTFAYPFGQTQPALKRTLESQFDGMRGISPGAHHSHADLNQIKSYPLFSGPSIDTALKAIADLAERPAWMTFFTHDICENHSPWGCAPDEFGAVIRAVENINADVMPVATAIDVLRGPS